MDVQHCINCNSGEKNSVNKKDGQETPSVPAADRRLLVLKFLDKHDMPLPPLAIYFGMLRQYELTFSYRTVQNILSELTEEDDLIRVDTSALRDGELEKVPEEDDSRRRAYYFITDQGRERVMAESNT